MNVCGNIRSNSNSTVLFIGWMRCKFEPYLINNQVVYSQDESFPEFIDAVKYTVQDYYDYIQCFTNTKSNDVDEKLIFLLQNLNSMDNDELINLIETNNNKFPNEEDYNNIWILNENFNNILKKGKPYTHLLQAH
tara:strand:+ start:650 stop:1054 length:405 start_codon:yes stop_codon:yes gene_type:complete